MAVREKVDDNKFLATLQSGGRLAFNKPIREKMGLDEGTVVKITIGGEEKELECPHCGESFEENSNEKNLLEIRKAEIVVPEE